MMTITPRMITHISTPTHGQGLTHRPNAPRLTDDLSDGVLADQHTLH